jgi:hypothetical protein
LASKWTEGFWYELFSCHDAFLPCSHVAITDVFALKFRDLPNGTVILWKMFTLDIATETRAMRSQIMKILSDMNKMTILRYYDTKVYIITGIVKQIK